LPYADTATLRVCASDDALAIRHENEKRDGRIVYGNDDEDESPYRA